jgi:hypothetical protein
MKSCQQPVLVIQRDRTRFVSSAVKGASASPARCIAAESLPDNADSLRRDYVVNIRLKLPALKGPGLGSCPAGTFPASKERSMRQSIFSKAATVAPWLGGRYQKIGCGRVENTPSSKFKVF